MSAGGSPRIAVPARCRCTAAPAVSRSTSRVPGLGVWQGRRVRRTRLPVPSLSVRRTAGAWLLSSFAQPAGLARKAGGGRYRSDRTTARPRGEAAAAPQAGLPPGARGQTGAPPTPRLTKGRPTEAPPRVRGVRLSQLAGARLRAAGGWTRAVAPAPRRRSAPFAAKPDAAPVRKAGAAAGPRSGLYPGPPRGRPVLASVSLRWGLPCASGRPASVRSWRSRPGPPRGPGGEVARSRRARSRCPPARGARCLTCSQMWTFVRAGLVLDARTRL